MDYCSIITIMHPRSDLNFGKYFNKRIMSFMGCLSNSNFPFMKQLFIVVANNYMRFHWDKIQLDLITTAQVNFLS